MTATGHCNGWTVVYMEGEWRWFDTLAPTSQEVNEHPCPRCGRPPREDGHDACLGHIHGAVGACCGHGIERGYVTWSDNGVEHNEDLGIAPVGGFPVLSAALAETAREGE